MQREMERRIRAARRELNGYNAAIQNADGLTKAEIQKDFDKAAVKLKRQEAVYKDFSYKTGISTQNDRLQTTGFGKSISQKAVSSATRHYKKWLHDIGATEGAPKKLSGYYKGKFDKTWEHELLMGYNKAVKKGDVSPLVSFKIRP